jgi:NADH-quinone oxidoreductase subunit G
VWLGALALHHPDYARLRALGSRLAATLGASFGVLAEGANAAGAWIAGAVPAGAGARHAGMLLSSRSDAVVLLGTEPWDDSLHAGAKQALRDSGFVVALTPFASNEMRDVASVMLPVGTFAETSGTYVNLSGTWQSFAGAATPVGEARPAWKVLRVLGNLLGLQGFEQQSSEEVRQEMKSAAAPAPLASAAGEGRSMSAALRTLETPMYQADPLVRRAPALQRTRLARALRGIA